MERINLAELCGINEKDVDSVIGEGACQYTNKLINDFNESIERLASIDISEMDKHNPGLREELLSILRR